jgi:hypothetical protein
MLGLRAAADERLIADDAAVAEVDHGLVDGPQIGQAQAGERGVRLRRCVSIAFAHYLASGRA